jgi:hypothetical protein
MLFTEVQVLNISPSLPRSVTFPRMFPALEIIPFRRTYISHLLIAISHCQLGPGVQLKS